MRRLVLLALSTAAAAAAAFAAPKPAAPKPVPPTPAAVAARLHAGPTRCAACHVVSGWGDVRFNHERTGFPLRDAHEKVRCRQCHTQDFNRPVADTCSGCHRDRHGGQLGLQCEGCHDERSWRPLFGVDAHRRTGFPLTGRHGLIPCQECHGNQRDRTFTQAPLRCIDCHRADYERTRLTAIDHAASGFSTDCQSCHDTRSFGGAAFGDHDLCFRISGGPHRGISCLDCHTSLAAFTLSGTCTTTTASCTNCHTHACDRTARQHEDVMGYECRDRKCYECHRQSGD